MLRDLCVWLYMRTVSLFTGLFAFVLAAAGLSDAAGHLDLIRNGQSIAGVVVEAPSPTAGTPSGQAAERTQPSSGVCPTVEYEYPKGQKNLYQPKSLCVSAPKGHPVELIMSVSEPGKVRSKSELYLPLVLGGGASLLALFAWVARPKREALDKLMVDPPLSEGGDVVALADQRGVRLFASVDSLPPLQGVVQSAGLIGEGKYPLDLCELCAYLSALAYERVRADGGDEKNKPDVTVADYLKSFPGDGSVSPFRDVAVFYNQETEGFGFVFDGARFVILRGTTGWGDWKTNLDARWTRENECLPPWLTKAPPRHTGFATAWGAIRDQVVTWLEQDGGSRGLPVIVSGHSLGGALSFIGAWELATKGHDVKAVITFGAALPGGKPFADDYKRLGLDQRTLRLEFTRDIVPVAQKLIGYVPVGHVWEPKQLPFLSLRAALASLPIVWIASSLGKGLIPAGKKDSAEPGTPPDKTPMSRKMRSWLHRLIIFGLLSGMLALAAHQMQKRYAMALSIMSYRKIRARRLAAAGGDKLSPADLSASYDDLRKHLRAIRGSDPDNARPFNTIPGLPRAVASPDEMRWMNAFFSARSW